MPSILLETRISAPIERVFDLSRSIDAHVTTTEGSDERAVAGRTTGLIELGDTVTWEAKHLGIRQRLSVRITSFDRPNYFEDEMLAGAFASMKHTHKFAQIDGGTVMKDHFFFEAPFGILGRMAEQLFLVRYMKGLLLRRSLILKRIAESDEWRRYITSSDEPSKETTP